MLRNYQLEICEKVNEAFEMHRSLMMQMPTGTGKTVVLASLVRQYLNLDEEQNQGCSVLIVAHRMELIEQIGAFLNHSGIDFGVIAGGKWPASFQQVMVASIQTLAKKQNQNLTPSLVVIDEAHHALAKSYQMLWNAWPEARFLGLTATPYRLSGDGFTDLFEVLVDSWSIKQFIAEGWLSPYDYYSIRPESEDQRLIDSLKKRGADGDFQMKELHEKLDVRPSIERLYESFKRYAAGKKGIVYAIDIAHAEHIADYYRLQGVAAVVVSSKTPLADRKRLIDTFKDSSFENTPIPSSIQILVSVDLFSEGFDCPDVEFIQLARPTLSLAKYLQMVGRGLRPYKGKDCCTILDNVGLYRTFGLPSEDRTWGDFFLGKVLDMEPDGNRNEQFLWLGCGSLQDESDDDIVKIVSHEGMVSRFACLSGVGFECRKKGKVTIWRDLVTGVEFDRCPKVVNYRELELATADGELFFPRIHSKWIDAKHGIDRKALETQVGEGIGWMKLYVSPALPQTVLQLQSVKANQVRIYKDEQGRVFLQQDPDHVPLLEEEAGGRKVFLAYCDAQQKAWPEEVKMIRKSSLKFDPQTGWWRIPAGSVKEKEWYGNRQGRDVYHIIYEEKEESKEFWVDGATGFTYRHRPVIRKRGFVELLVDGEVVYVLNIHEERFMPYHNWEIRADERICTIGNKLYFNEEKEERAYRIKKRSDDFRMFVVEAKFPKDNSDAMEYDEFMIINKAGKKLEIKKYSATIP